MQLLRYPVTRSLAGDQVVARTTSFSFKGRHEDVRSIAHKVGVRAVLEGSVQARANGRRIVAQLVAVHHNYAWMLTMSGRFVEAEHEYATAHELDPLDPMLRVHCALVDYYRREFTRAERAFARVLEMEPANLVVTPRGRRH